MKPDKDRITELEGQVKQLMEFMKQKKENQLSFPLDYPTQQILQNGVPIVIGAQVPGVIASANGYLPVRVNNKTINIMYT